MRKLLVLALAVGCSGGSDEIPAFAGRHAVDEATLENRVYYIDLSVADTPLTESELNDPGGAIPIRLLAGEDFVVAMGVDPTLGSTPMDRVMGIWAFHRDLLPGEDVVDWDDEVLDIDPDDLDALLHSVPAPGGP